MCFRVFRVFRVFRAYVHTYIRKSVIRCTLIRFLRDCTLFSSVCSLPDHTLPPLLLQRFPSPLQLLRLPHHRAKHGPPPLPCNCSACPTTVLRTVPQPFLATALPAPPPLLLQRFPSPTLQLLRLPHHRATHGPPPLRGGL